MRTEYCGRIDANYLGKTVNLFGWVHRRRDHGGVIFIDLWDREGVVQIVCNPDNPTVFACADTLRPAYVLRISGVVRARPAGADNPALVSGTIEILCDTIDILNASVTPPFLIDDEHLNENTRLAYRVLDLRRPRMQHNLRLRYKTTLLVRNFLDQHGFMDIETPMLTRSTPEGARDYLSPSRVHPGQFFALPQSPQLFKQLLMVSGFDRYYQIVKCFRDEDLRADRQPEFTQIDLETAFLNENQIMEIAESLVQHIFQSVLGETLGKFPRLTYAEAMFAYGSDKPDLRIPLRFTELTDVMKLESFKVFRAAADLPNGRVVGLCIPEGANLSRSEIDAYTQFVGIYGAKGLAYIKVNDITQPNETGLQSPIVKFLSPSTLTTLLHRTNAKNGDLIFFGADRAKVVHEAMGALRQKIAHARDLVEPGWRPLWVTDFPMFEWDEEAKRWNAVHHPFTSPHDAHAELLETDPGQCVAKAYDMVLNGWEIGGGSIRIHQAELQAQVFKALHIDAQEAQQKFGFLLDNLKFGAPPHGGLAFGLDRLVALMAGADSIRDVIAFPKTQRAQCLLTDAPNTVSENQLRELHIRLRKTDTAQPI